MKEYPWGKGTPKWTRDAALNDSDKSFTVPAGKLWYIKSVVASLLASATVGNRAMAIVFTDPSGNFLKCVGPTAFIAAATRSVIYAESGGLIYSSQVRYGPDGVVTTPAASTWGIGEVILPEGYMIRVYDALTIDPAADDLSVVIHYVEYDA